MEQGRPIRGDSLPRESEYLCRWARVVVIKKRPMTVPMSFEKFRYDRTNCPCALNGFALRWLRSWPAFRSILRIAAATPVRS